MKRTKEELIASLKTMLGDDSSDESLSLLEDVSDSMEVDADVASLNQQIDDWKNKYETNDAQWRQKYRDRFYGEVDESEEESMKDSFAPKKLTFESLFKTED